MESLQNTHSGLVSNVRNLGLFGAFDMRDSDERDKTIGLIADENSLINNLFYHTSIATATKGKGELLSVTIVKNHVLSEKQLISKITKELQTFCGISNTTFIKRYQIKKALPKLDNLQYEISSTETKLTSSIFLAGDQLLNGSLNAAMIAGERAAMGVIGTLQDGLIVDELSHR